MKYSKRLLFIFGLIIMSSCSPAIPEPTETIVPSETPAPTIKPTRTITPSPTLTPTITTTPTPSPTPLAGATGLLVQCGSSFYNYDLLSQDYVLASDFAGNRSEQKIKTQLTASGIPFSTVDSWSLPDEYQEAGIIDFLAASKSNNTFLLIQRGDTERILWVNISDSSIKEVLSVSGLWHGAPAGHDIFVNNYSDEVFLEQWQDDNGEYTQSGDIYVLSIIDGSVSNITETQNTLAQALSVSRDGMQVSYSTTGEGVWIYDRNTDKHSLIYKYSGQIPVTDIHPFENILLFWDGGGSVYTIDIYGNNLLKLITGIDNIGLITYPHWTPDGRIAAIIRKDGVIRQWALIDPATGDYQTYEIPSDFIRWAYTRFNWSPDGKWFTADIVAGQGNKISPIVFLCNTDEANCHELNNVPNSPDKGCYTSNAWINTSSQSFP